jgi:signal transduction histidine kinase
LQANVDPYCFDQVVTNLVDNAIRYSLGPISIRLEGYSNTLRLSVADHGPGIAPELRSHIFERFYQAQPGHGLGLGLYISREIVELHGGKLHAEFPAEGGTRFIVELPEAVL